MSQKDCGSHHGKHRSRTFFRRLFSAILAASILVGFIVLVVWLVLRPTKPSFHLQDATVLRFNLTDDQTNLLTAVVQLTVSSRNPNDNIGIFYDEIDVFAQYKGQRITGSTSLPAGYQGHKDMTIWSPYLYGDSIPVAPLLASPLRQDRNAGFLLLYVKVHGQVRWKVGTWISGHYHLDAACPAFFTMSGGGNPRSPASFHFQKATSCNVDVGM